MQHKTQTTSHSENGLLVRMQISDRVLPLFKTTPILPTTPFLWEKIRPPFFFEKIRKFKPPL